MLPEDLKYMECTSVKYLSGMRYEYEGDIKEALTYVAEEAKREVLSAIKETDLQIRDYVFVLTVKAIPRDLLFSRNFVTGLDIVPYQSDFPIKKRKGGRKGWEAG